MKKSKKEAKKDDFVSQNKDLLGKLTKEKIHIIDEIMEENKFSLGLIVRSSTVPKYFHGITTTLFPLMIQENVFKYALALQNEICNIFDKLSINTAYIIDNTRQTNLKETFVNKMLYMYAKSSDKTQNRSLRANVIRTTFTIEASTKAHTPVEKMLKFHSLETCSFNSVSFSSPMVSVHNKIIDYLNYGKKDENILYQGSAVSGNIGLLPGIGQFIAIVWNEYRKRNVANHMADMPLYILIVINKSSIYTTDHTKLCDYISESINTALEAENNFFKQERPRVFLVSLMEIKTALSVDENNGNLYYSDNKKDIPKGEVSVVYFNTGDKSRHYKLDAIWELRSTIEFSNAIKIPSIGMQLLKYIDISKQIYKSDASANTGFFKTFKDKLSNLFYKSTYFDENPGFFEKLLNHAKKDPTKFIIRDANGDLIDGDKLTQLIDIYENEADSKILQGVSIQKHPTPMSQFNYVKQPTENDPALIECTPLLSIWGLYIHDSKKEIYNRVAGYSCFCKLLQSEKQDDSLIHSSAILY